MWERRGSSGRGDTGGWRGGRSEKLGCGKGKGHKSDDARTMPHEVPRRSGIFHSARLNLALNVRLVAERPRNPRVSRETESEALGLR